MQEAISRKATALALAIMVIGGKGREEAAWEVAKSDPLLGAEITKEAWLAWARRTIGPKTTLQ